MSKKKPPTPVEELEQTTEEELESQAAIIKRQGMEIRRLVRDHGNWKSFASAIVDYLPVLRLPKKRAAKKKAKSGAWEMVALLSDCHATEAWGLGQTDGLSEYSFEQFCRNLWYYGEEIIRLRDEDQAQHGLTVLHVDMLGDIFHGALRVEDEVTNDFPTVPGLANTTWVLWQWLVMLSEHFDRIACTCVAGNHGRLHKKPQSKRYVEENKDSLVYFTLRQFATLAGVGCRIAFDIPLSRTHTITRLGHKVKLGHGDHIRGGNSIANIPIYGLSRDILRQNRKDTAKAKRDGGGGVSLFEFGHFHQANYLEDVLLINGALCPPSPWAVDALGASGGPKQWIYHTSERFTIRALTPLSLDGITAPHGFSSTRTS